MPSSEPQSIPPSSKEGTRPPGVTRLHAWEKAARPALPSQRQILELSCGGSARPLLYSVPQFPGSPKWAGGPQSPRPSTLGLLCRGAGPLRGGVYQMLLGASSHRSSARPSSRDVPPPPPPRDAWGHSPEQPSHTRNPSLTSSVLAREVLRVLHYIPD